jgi:23S rRNA pseudouridine2605 synthase
MLGKRSSGRSRGSDSLIAGAGFRGDQTILTEQRRRKKGSLLTAEQLQAARAAHWRQNQNAIRTLDDAKDWFSRHPLSLFSPRRAQLPAPAPSLVEACLGKADATPPHTAVEQAKGLLARMMASDSVLALNLLGIPGEQPDFVVHKEALPFLVSLRGERDWKHAPGSSAIHKVSPLVVELWKALEQGGPLTADGVRDKLGRELTESAVLRALSELWQSLRAIPVLQPEGQPAIWELLETHHGDAIARGSATSQVTAISLLVSMYLQSVYAASGEEIEVFLSPLASRSRIREAVRGLSATRQIHSLSMETQTYYFLEDGLPEFAQTEPKTEPQRGRGARETQESAAPVKFVPRPRRPVPSPNRTGPPSFRPPAAARPVAPPPAAGQGSSRARPGARPDRGDFKRRKDARPAYGKRPGPRPGQREAMAEGRGASENFPPRQEERPPARKKERWRNTPGKPGYRPDRAQGAAPPTRRSRPVQTAPEGGFSAPARPFSKGGRSTPGGRSAPHKGTPQRKFQDHGAFQDRKAGAQGFERPRRRPPASGPVPSRGQESPRTGKTAPSGPPYGRPGGGRFRAGKPSDATSGGGRPRTGITGPGRPRPGGTGRPPSERSGKPGGGERSAWTRPPLGARSRPKAGAGGFGKPHSEGGRAAKGTRRSFGTKPAGFTPGRRPATGKSDFRGRGPRSQDRGRKKPEA